MKKFIIFISLLFLCQNSFAAVPFVFTNGTVADATEVNSDMNYFENKFSTTSGHDHDGLNSNATLKGVWNGTPITAVYGGTGFSSYASGDLMYATSDTGLAILSKPVTLGSILLFGATNSTPEWLSPGTSGQSLVSQGSGNNPYWASTTPVVGIFTRDVSLSSGNQSVTGLGFKPRVVIFFTAVGSTSAASWGIDNISGTVCVNDANVSIANAYSNSNSASITLRVGAADIYEGKISSFDADGFTMTWTKTNAPTGTAQINYAAYF